MAAAPSSSTSASKPTQAAATPDPPASKPADAPIEEDDEFEDFPVEDWTEADTEMPGGDAGAATQHLWEESWDDDDTQEDFAKMLKEELKKVDGK